MILQSGESRLPAFADISLDRSHRKSFGTRLGLVFLGPALDVHEADFAAVLLRVETSSGAAAIR